MMMTVMTAAALVVGYFTNPSSGYEAAFEIIKHTDGE